MTNKKEQIKRFWLKLNETKVEDIIPYIKKNKKEAILALGVVVILVGVIYLVKMNLQVFGTGAQEQTASVLPQQEEKVPATTKSTYLPETKRTIENRPVIKDPFAGSMVLKGVITGGGGSNLAIIEIGNTSYIAGEGTEITGGLVVGEVQKDSVILMSGKEKLYLEFNGRLKLEKDKDVTKTEEKETGDTKKGGN